MSYLKKSLVLVNSVLVTRTALFDHQLHNVINQSFPSTLCFDWPLPLPFKSRMLSEQVPAIVLQASLWNLQVYLLLFFIMTVYMHPIEDSLKVISLYTRVQTRTNTVYTMYIAFHDNVPLRCMSCKCKLNHQTYTLPLHRWVSTPLQRPCCPLTVGQMWLLW